MADVKSVRMTHPKLPGREIWVRPTGVKTRERAGWRVGAASSKSTVSAAPAAASMKES